MSRRYDSRTTMFSPEGRLYQVKKFDFLLFSKIGSKKVEYAMEAVGHAGTCMGILAKDGIVVCAEKKNQHKLLDIYELFLQLMVDALLILFHLF